MEINFIYQVKRFQRFKRENVLSANAQALWLEIFGLFNSNFFPEKLPVSTTHLCMILHISKDTVLRARKELEENGLILTERGKTGRSATVITMRYFQKDCGQVCGETVDNSFCSAQKDASCGAREETNDASDKKTQDATQGKVCGAQKDASCDTYKTHNPGNSQNLYEEDDDTAAVYKGRAQTACEIGMAHYFGRQPTPAEKELLTAGMTCALTGWDFSELIDPALEMASMYGAKSAGIYAARVIAEWKKLHIHTRKQAEEYRNLQSWEKSAGDYDEKEEASNALMTMEEELSRDYIKAVKAKNQGRG